MENKTKMFGKNCFDNVVSDLFKNALISRIIGFEKKVHYTFLKMDVFLLFFAFFQSDFMY